MKIRASVATAVTVLVLPVLVAGCGDPGADAPTGQQSQADPETTSAAPAERPTGTTARTISYRCASGREGTLAVDVPDLDRLADRLDRIQPCEYDRGLATFSLSPSPAPR